LLTYLSITVLLFLDKFIHPAVGKRYVKNKKNVKQFGYTMHPITYKFNGNAEKTYTCYLGIGIFPAVYIADME